MMGNASEFNDNDYQEDYRLHYSGSGHTYMHVRPAYRYGYQMATEARYAKYDWNEGLERDLRRTWDGRGAAMRWEDARHAIREGWNRARGLGGKPRPLGSSTYNLSMKDIE